MSTQDSAGRPQVFSPLARAVFDRFNEAVILFDPDGRLVYANKGGRDLLESLSGNGELDTRSLLPRLGRRGGRVERLSAGALTLGNAVFVPGSPSPETLATRERDAIVGTLHATGWRLTETARRLGISRTTLWRRLREWGIEAPPGGDGE
jgi:lambda repressor-like predicted transcriptional regulator